MTNRKSKKSHGGKRKGSGRPQRISLDFKAPAEEKPEEPRAEKSRITLATFFKVNDDRPLPCVTEYANDVISGKIPSGSLAVLAAQRFFSDLDEGPKRGLVFDRAAARKILSWFEDFCGLQLMPWQQFNLAQLFGWKRTDGLRRFRLWWLETGRKNGKSSTLAGIGNYCLIADGEKYAQVYSLATMRDQAKIIFGDARRMRDENSELQEHVRKFVSELAVEDTGSFFRPLASEAKSLDGLRGSCFLLDEIHEWPSREQWDKAEGSMVGRTQSLMAAATTAGENRETFAYEKHLYLMRVLSGAIIDDDALVFIAAMDEQDDYRDERLWIKSNPSLDVTVRKDALRSKVKEIENLPSAKSAFLRFHANQWISVTADHTLPLDKISACSGIGAKNPSVELKAFLSLQEGERCFAGFDRGLTGDLSSLVLVWPAAIPGKFAAAAWFWMPENGLLDKEKAWGVPLRQWVKDGWIRVLPGDFIGDDAFESEIKEIAKRFPIADIGFDPYFSMELMARIKAHGAVREATGIPQTEKMLSEPSDKLLKMVLEVRLMHFGHPVLSWNLANVVLTPNERTQGLRPNKLNRNEKIDGVSALVNAIQRATFSEYAPRPSTYDTRGIVTL